jgi:hypothetical protein
MKFIRIAVLVLLILVSSVGAIRWLPPSEYGKYDKITIMFSKKSRQM